MREWSGGGWTSGWAADHDPSSAVGGRRTKSVTDEQRAEWTAASALADWVAGTPAHSGSTLRQWRSAASGPHALGQSSLRPPLDAQHSPPPTAAASPSPPPIVAGPATLAPLLCRLGLRVGDCPCPRARSARGWWCCLPPGPAPAPALLRRGRPAGRFLARSVSTPSWVTLAQASRPHRRDQRYPRYERRGPHRHCHHDRGRTFRLLAARTDMCSSDAKGANSTKADSEGKGQGKRRRGEGREEQ